MVTEKPENVVVVSDSEVKSVVVKSEKPVKTVNKKKSKKFFIFDDAEIETFGDREKKIILLKKAEKDIPRGADFFMWKLIVGVAKAQTNPFVLKWLGLRGDFCKTCGTVSRKGAICAWMDRHFDNTTGKKVEKEFSIAPVCEKCLLAAHAIHLDEADLFITVIEHAEEATFMGMHNMKDFCCAFPECHDHMTDSSLVQIPFQGKLISLPVCDKHFNAIIAPIKKKGVDPTIAKAEEWYENGDIDQKLLDLIKARGYERIRNK